MEISIKDADLVTINGNKRFWDRCYFCHNPINVGGRLCVSVANFPPQRPQ
jgi:hypothetical protein